MTITERVARIVGILSIASSVAACAGTVTDGDASDDESDPDQGDVGRFGGNLSWLYNASTEAPTLVPTQKGSTPEGVPRERASVFARFAPGVGFHRHPLPSLAPYQALKIHVTSWEEDDRWKSPPILCLMGPSSHFCTDRLVEPNDDAVGEYLLRLDSSTLPAAWASSTYVIVTTAANFDARRAVDSDNEEYHVSGIYIGLR
jgi:hypothetical protein